MAKLGGRSLAMVCALVAAFVANVQAADKERKSLIGKKTDAKVRPASAPAPHNFDDVVASVNGEPITRGQLADELITTYGKRQLEMIVNRKLIEQACRQEKINVTRADVDNEINDTLKRLNLKRKEFIERVLGSREMTYAQYIRDTIWPALALKQLVKDKVTINEDDLKKAFEANYGEKVDVRMLVVVELRKAQELWEKVSQEKDEAKRLALFEDFCKSHSIDAATRSFAGKTQPINRHTGYPEVENLAFSLKKGELSKIIQIPEGNLMLLCVDRIPARTDVTLDSPFNPKLGPETVRDVLKKDLWEKKMRVEVAQYFQGVHTKAKIENFLTGEFDPEVLRVEHAEAATKKGTSPSTGVQPASASTASAAAAAAAAGATAPLTPK